MIVSKETRQALEIDDVLSLLAEKSRSDLGRNALLTLTPLSDMAALSARQKLFKAYLSCTSEHGDFPWNNAAEPVVETLAEARHSGLLLGDELLKVRTLLTLATEVREKAQSFREDYAEFSWFCTKIRDFDNEISALAVLQSDGTLADSASADLRAIREELGAKRRDARSIGNSFLNSSQASMLQERVLSLRNGRFVVLVRQAYATRFPGIVTDKSSSGNSLYMEPHSLVACNNRIAALLEAQRREERKIFGRLTTMLLKRLNAVVDAESALSELDLFYRMSELIYQKQWHLPELVHASEFRFYALRHPLLGEKAVPIDVRCGREFRALIVTGPNTGGKTVALKTSAMALYLAWCGMPVPACDGSSVGDISAIYADIGDEQSIEQSLSTFSSHLKRIVTMLSEADGKALVLLDELGAGTDPQEGAALGIAVLEEFLRRRTLVLATTHHNPIKRFATVTPGVEAACVDFDMKTLSPTYRLLVGIPGQSNALAIAKRYGMPDAIVRRATECLNSDEVNAERLIGQLQEKSAANEKLSRELNEQKQQLDAQRRSLQQSREATELRRDEMILKAEREAQRVRDTAEAQARSLLKTLTGVAESAGHREMAKHKKKIDNSRSASEDRQRTLEARHAPKSAAAELRPGVNVKLRDSAVKGEIVSVSGSSAEVQAGAMRITVPLANLEVTAAPQELLTRDEVIASKAPVGVPSSIMVRGMLADEAIPLVESYLDRAMRAGYGEVTVIHGRGEGILRRLVHKLCARLPYVTEYRLGDIGEGGYGVTIVKFK